MINFALSTASEQDIHADEMTGDVTDDAIYYRNRSIEERFNVKIETAIPTDDLYSRHNTVANTVLAGDNVYDVCGHYAYQLSFGHQP